MTDRTFTILYFGSFLLFALLAGLLVAWLQNVVGIHWWWLPLMVGHTVGGLGRELWWWMVR